MGSRDEIKKLYAKAYREQNKERLQIQTKKWKKNNKSKIKQNSKEYYDANRDKILTYHKEYSQRPEVAERHRQRNAASYLKNREKVLTRQANRRKERLTVINEIALRYGCQNKDCKWSSDFNPWQLDFHHLDPSTKVIEVAKLESSSWTRINTEVNKCVVLCKNCHANVHHGEVVVDQTMLCSVDLLVKNGTVIINWNN